MKAWSIRGQLILVILILACALTGLFGLLAYRSSREILKQEAIHRVALVAGAHKDALYRQFSKQRGRAENFLQSTQMICEPGNYACFRRLFEDFVVSERATSAALAIANQIVSRYGEDVPEIANINIQPPQLARFGSHQGRHYYAIQASYNQGANKVTLIFGSESINSIFRDRTALGESGESFMTDSRGYFLTPPYLPSHHRVEPLHSKPMIACLSGQSGETLAADYRGVAMIHGFRYLPEIGGGCVMAHINQSEAFAPALRLQKKLLALAMLFFAISIVLSFGFAHLITKPLEALTMRTQALQAGDFDSKFPSEGPHEIRRFSAAFALMVEHLKNAMASEKKARRQAEDTAQVLETSVKEKELLLQEVHHRVKNNLQVMSSLLSLQSRKIQDPNVQKMLKESENRIKSMALVHQKLYGTDDLSHVPLTDYISDLCGHLFRSYNVDAGKIHLKIQSDSAPININAAVPLGLILNELISNSLKYAFKTGEQGQISLILNSDNNHAISLEVRDDGAGLPERIDVNSAETLGLRLVKILVAQLDGSIERLATKKGTAFRMFFPRLRSFEERNLEEAPVSG